MKGSRHVRYPQTKIGVVPMTRRSDIITLYAAHGLVAPN